MRGGRREGAGRPPSGIRKFSIIIRLRAEAANALRRSIPERRRSEWIEQLIERELADQQSLLERYCNDLISR